MVLLIDDLDEAGGAYVAGVCVRGMYPLVVLFALRWSSFEAKIGHAVFRCANKVQDCQSSC